jgi:hypothetical protein
VHFGEDNNSQGALMGNPKPGGCDPRRSIIHNGSAARVGQGIRQNRSLTIAQAERRQVGRNWDRVNADKPSGLVQRLHW